MLDASQPSHMLAIGGASYQMCVTQIPTLTGFIPSLDSGRTFRVSIHSWEKPQPSDLFRQLWPNASRMVFETRLYIDGKLKALKYLEEHSQWPQVIGMSQSLSLFVTNIWSDCASRNHYDPTTTPLHFPPFRPELLQQSHWDAGDDLSRIRLVITEGMIQNNSPVLGRSFDKVRDVVIFSFQHAPKHILEYSGIAWPNARMFQRTPGTLVPQPDMDAHAHSPQRSKRPAMRMTNTKSAQKQSTSPTSLQSSKWAGKASIISDDPFIAPVQSSRSRRKTSDDVSMPDCAAKVNSSKNASEMSGVTTQQLDFAQQLERAAVDEIFDSLSPAKKQALIDYLSTPKQVESISQRSSKTLTASRTSATDSAQRPHKIKAIASHRRSSTESRRSTSGQSTTMSWEGTPTLGDIWTSSEYPGLLPTIQSQPSGVRSDSLGPKRKRSTSPSAIEVQTNETLQMVKDMSTSPCKDALASTEVSETVVATSRGSTASKE